MPLLKFPAPFRHDHPPVRDVNAVLAQRRTPGEAAADAVAATVGSWRFIIVQSCLLAVWPARMPCARAAPAPRTCNSKRAMDEPDADLTRRRALLVATSAAGGAAVAAVAWPFLASMQPSERAKALGAPVEVDLNPLEPGTMMIVAWQGKPVWVVNRTQPMLDSLAKSTPLLADPDSKHSEQPSYATNPYRSIKPEYLVVVGICTHLGCSPTPKFQPGEAGMGPSWPGGFLCPCHGSRFDLAARVYANMPAPTNLVVPRYEFLSSTRILIGDDRKPA